MHRKASVLANEWLCVKVIKKQKNELLIEENLSHE